MSTLPNLQNIPRQSDEDYQKVLDELREGDELAIVRRYGDELVWSQGKAQDGRAHGGWSNGYAVAYRHGETGTHHVAIIERAPLPIPDDCRVIVVERITDGGPVLYTYRRTTGGEWTRGFGNVPLNDLRSDGKVIPVTLPEGVEL